MLAPKFGEPGTVLSTTEPGWAAEPGWRGIKEHLLAGGKLTVVGAQLPLSEIHLSAIHSIKHDMAMFAEVTHQLMCYWWRDHLSATAPLSARPGIMRPRVPLCNLRYLLDEIWMRKLIGILNCSTDLLSHSLPFFRRQYTHPFSKLV